MDEIDVQAPACPRCGPKFIQIQDWIRAPRPEAKFVCHRCDVEYQAYVPRNWVCPGGWLPAFA